MSKTVTLPTLPSPPTMMGSLITMTSCGKHKHATEHDDSTLRLCRVVPDRHIDFFGNKHSMLDIWY